MRDFALRSLYRMARSKAYLFRGVQIGWQCAPALLAGVDLPAKETFHFANGLLDFLRGSLTDRALVAAEVFNGEANLADGAGRVEWAICWPADGNGFIRSYCNTVPTPAGGSHEAGLRAGLTKALRTFGEMTN